MFKRIIVALPLALGACVPGTAIITMPPQVQSACTFLAIGVPIAEGFRSSMSVTAQALLTSGEQAVADCAAGNATATVIDVSMAIEQLLASRGVSRAAVMSRATHHR